MNTTFEPSPPAGVERRADGDRWTLVFVRVLRHAPERVWAALTEPAQLEAWAPFTADRDLARTGDATLTMIDGDVAEDLPASVRRAEPPTLLEYTWGTDLLRWRLEPSRRGHAAHARAHARRPRLGAEGRRRLASLPRRRRAAARR